MLVWGKYTRNHKFHTPNPRHSERYDCAKRLSGFLTTTKSKLRRNNSHGAGVCWVFQDYILLRQTLLHTLLCTCMPWSVIIEWIPTQDVVYDDIS